MQRQAQQTSQEMGVQLRLARICHGSTKDLWMHFLRAGSCREAYLKQVGLQKRQERVCTVP